MSFALDKRLGNSSVIVADWPLCTVLLKNDRRFPWLILVPKRADIREMHALEESDRQQVLKEICAASVAMEKVYKPEKMNVAALGNMVPQLHIHVIARFTDDAAWPNPIWGVGQEEPYSAEELEQTLSKLKGELDVCLQ